ncbi:hypothetical protein K503DRAFT_785458 [Rhizopogon vinicolor AM-OR11-026]|uniref:Uncharacterized protein n=1 Tax=Rhizopogon vinicolor AM-OR11-026 TaxID=1314800 RepID=A0A1B7MQK6_9AGAM|nr:hypothetical protein K503DRAFT_785458 [Rhizopogon vinicolor AM-OR11-026]
MHLLLAGISDRWLCFFDLRTPAPTTINIATKVHGIATSPIDLHQIVGCGDGIVTGWDARRLPHHLLTFTEKDAAVDGARTRGGSGGGGGGGAVDMGWQATTLESYRKILAQIQHSQTMGLDTSLHGYEFSNQGLLGLWEEFAPLPQVPDSGSPSFSVLDGILTVPTTSLVNSSLSPLSTCAVLGPLTRMRLEQRRFALHLCEWGIGEDVLNHAIRRWEKEGHLSRAACWLVFTRQNKRALELHMRSDDEMHNLVSGTLTTLIPSNGGTPSNELRDHTERVIVHLRDLYFRVMLTQLASKDWSEVFEEELLPLRERLAIAFQHEHFTWTGDVQTAAILGAHASPAKFADACAERWLETYRDLLDGFKLFHHCIAFDIERGQILQDAGYRRDGRALPRCSVCLMTLSTVPDGTREAELSHSHTAYQDTIDEAIVICQICRHSGHASHILDWFFGEDGARSRGMCPVADCDGL